MEQTSLGALGAQISVSMVLINTGTLPEQAGLKSYRTAQPLPLLAHACDGAMERNKCRRFGTGITIEHYKSNVRVMYASYVYPKPSFTHPKRRSQLFTIATHGYSPSNARRFVGKHPIFTAISVSAGKSFRLECYKGLVNRSQVFDLVIQYNLILRSYKGHSLAFTQWSPCSAVSP